MMSWANDLFPINRSITGKGVRETINFIKKKINNNFKIKKISSSTKVFDWTVPNEWELKAFIKDDKGKKFVTLRIIISMF